MGKTVTGNTENLGNEGENQKGFTLIEILVAVVILALVVIGIMTLLPTGYLQITESGRISTMNHLAQLKIDELRSTSYSDPDLVAGTQPSPFPEWHTIDSHDYSIEWLVTDNQAGVPIGASSETNLKTVTVTVGYLLYDSAGNPLSDDTNFQRSVTFDTYITR